MVSTPQLSVGVAAKLTLAERSEARRVGEVAGGGLTVGSVLSVTVTLKLPLALLPWMSVTVTSTVWLPTAKTCGEVMTVSPSLYSMVSTPQLSVLFAYTPLFRSQALASLLTAMAAGGLT